MKKLTSFVSRNIFPILLTAVALVLVAVNYTPGTFLTGWDTLHPEFDLGLNIKRVFFGVWREEQGLGALAGHSHMADLPRILWLSLSSLFLPLNALRYSFFFLSLILGPVGVYYFIKFALERFPHFSTPEESHRATSGVSLPLAAFFGGLFYLLNLGTLQHFYVPFEMFAAAYAFLPWLFLFAAKFFQEGRRRYLALFLLITFLATPMAYAATLWYVYFFALAIFGFAFFLLNRKTLANFSRLITILLVTLAINAYWLLPNFYFMKTSGVAVAEAKINQLFSGKAFAHDLKYSTFDNVSILRGFLFDWQEYREGKFVYLLDEWHKHLENPWVLSIGWILFGIVILGILRALFKRDLFSLALFPVFLLGFFFLTYGSPPFVYVMDFLRDQFGLFKEGLRFPWTKFSILVMLGYSFYFALAVFYLGGLVRKRLILYTLYFLLFTFLLVWMWPSFSGNLVSPSKRISIPQDYFKTFAWFAQKPALGRIAFFPTPAIWGWEYYNWGFEGAGFIWFGLNQPVLVRDFDRWSPANENFYWEASYALYTQNLALLEKVLEKYQVSWLLWDESMRSPAWPKALYREEFAELVAQSKKITLVETLGKLKIYKVSLEVPVTDFVFLAQNLPVVAPIYKWNNLDQGYIDNGNYLTLHPTPYTLNPIYYPFRSLFTRNSSEDNEFELEMEDDRFIFRKVLPEDFKDSVLIAPEFDPEGLAQVDSQDLSQIRYLTPEVQFDGQKVEIVIPRIDGYWSAEIQPAEEKLNSPSEDCRQAGEGEFKNEVIEEDGRKSLRLFARNTTNCSAAFWLSNLPHKIGYLVTVESRNLSGKSLLFWVENFNIDRADIETDLPKTGTWTKSYFIQPPMEEDGMGYGLHFDNISIGRQTSINDLGKITVNPIPYRFLTGIKLVKPGVEDRQPVYFAPEKVEHPNPSVYVIEPLATSHEPSVTLILSQAYHEGWVGYKIANGEWRIANSFRSFFPFFFGEELKEHVLVNNWANGWQIDDSQPITPNSELILIFWPQYLQYLGFVLMIAVPLIFFKTLRRSNRL